MAQDTDDRAVDVTLVGVGEKKVGRKEMCSAWEDKQVPAGQGRCLPAAERRPHLILATPQAGGLANSVGREGSIANSATVPETTGGTGEAQSILVCLPTSWP